MDINLLLSPQDSPRENPSSSSSSKPTTRKPRKPRSSKLINTNTPSLSPLVNSTLPPPSLPHSAVAQAHHVIPSPPPMASPVSALRVHAASTPPADSNRSIRQPSTPGMDTLADLASMQHHQQTARANAGGLRSAEIYESQSSPASVLHTLQAMPRPQGPVRTMDSHMTDAPTQTPSPRRYSTNSLSEAELQTIAQLVTYLATNPFAYESHVQLVKLLHQGFVSYVYPNSSSEAQEDPQKYDLLQDLRNAREAMNATFSLGEDLWVDWIEDQKLLARTLDDKITVIESCRKSVDEESGSTRLWLLYSEWMLSLYKIANPHDTRTHGVGELMAETLGWSDEDIIVAREVCGWQQMMEVWRQGIQETKWRLDDSHLLWDRYTQLLMQDLGSSPSNDAIIALKLHFLDRLQTPHATWDQTFQNFSGFISQYDNSAYEDTMVAANRQSSVAKNQYSHREIFEIHIREANKNSNKEAEWKSFNEYINWELAQSRKKNAFSFELVHALYQRATLRFPTDTSFWDGFVILINEEIATYGRRNLSALPVLDRATSHCPWSGYLWSQYLLAAEIDRRPFPDIDNIKHKATSTGLLDAGDMSEVLKVHTAWCGFLRRRAFHDDSTDEDIDVAEVGIRSSIENMETLGREKYGKDYPGDPEYRLQRIYIKYLSQCQNWEAARNAWKSLVPRQGDSYDFWLRYYLWEMSVWGKLAYSENEIHGSQEIKPSEATLILRQALQRPKLDWPEKILEVLQHHCEDHEGVEELQLAIIQIWKTKNTVKKRREKEALEAFEQAQSQKSELEHDDSQATLVAADNHLNASKRKREDDADAPELSASKKSRPDTNGNMKLNEDEQASTVPAQLKRDRENATVLVKNLPIATTETRVRQYFRDCGTINSLRLLPEADRGSATATIEFDSKDDVLTAQTKDMKTFDGNAIEVKVGTGATLFVTNFPPTADEKFIHEKFAKFGEVVDVRFPSLKANTHRRFCYVQFKSAVQAEAATELNGEVVDEKRKLIVKISDPGKKQDRTGAIYDGREIHLLNVDWTATEDDISETFSKYGKVEKVRIPRAVDGRSKGFAFVVFSNKEEATAALDMNLKMLKNRPVKVSSSTANPAKRQAATNLSSVPRSSNSPSPDLPSTNGDTNNAASPTMSTIAEQRPSATDIQSRTVVLLGVPDTVNDARIRALAEPYGTLVKVVLRPDHQGAIVEYKDVSSAGKAALGIDNHEIIPSRFLTIGTMAELLHQKAEVKKNKIGFGTSKEKGDASKPFNVTAPIRRPNQPGAKRGGRGGLGLKGAGVGFSGPRATTDGAGKELKSNGVAEDHQGKAKSNADFKAMFLKP